MDKLFVDRIESNFAVCENQDNEFINIPLRELPKDVHEGSVLSINNSGKYNLLKQEEIDRKNKLLKAQENLES